MRRESVTVQKCKKQMASLGFDSQLAYHRVKLILKIYRDVVWVLSERAEELHEYAWELGNRDADAGLCYLENFAPDIDLQEFEEKVCCVMESRMLVDVIDRALLRLKRYPDRGELYGLTEAGKQALRDAADPSKPHTYSWFVMTDCNTSKEQSHRALTLDGAIQLYQDSDRPEKRLGVTKDSIATVDLVRFCDGEQQFFEDYRRLESFRDDPAISDAAETIRQELKQTAPQEDITMGGM